MASHINSKYSERTFKDAFGYSQTIVFEALRSIWLGPAYIQSNKQTVASCVKYFKTNPDIIIQKRELLETTMRSMVNRQEGVLLFACDANNENDTEHVGVVTSVIIALDLLSTAKGNQNSLLLGLEPIEHRVHIFGLTARVFSMLFEKYMITYKLPIFGVVLLAVTTVQCVCHSVILPSWTELYLQAKDMPTVSLFTTPIYIATPTSAYVDRQREPETKFSISRTGQIDLIVTIMRILPLFAVDQTADQVEYVLLFVESIMPHVFCANIDFSGIFSQANIRAETEPYLSLGYRISFSTFKTLLLRCCLFVNGHYIVKHMSQFVDFTESDGPLLDSLFQQLDVITARQRLSSLTPMTAVVEDLYDLLCGQFGKYNSKMDSLRHLNSLKNQVKPSTLQSPIQLGAELEGLGADLNEIIGNTETKQYLVALDLETLVDTLMYCSPSFFKNLLLLGIKYRFYDQVFCIFSSTRFLFSGGDRDLVKVMWDWILGEDFILWPREIVQYLKKRAAKIYNPFFWHKFLFLTIRTGGRIDIASFIYLCTVLHMSHIHRGDLLVGRVIAEYLLLGLPGSPLAVRAPRDVDNYVKILDKQQGITIFPLLIIELIMHFDRNRPLSQRFSSATLVALLEGAVKEMVFTPFETYSIIKAAIDCNAWTQTNDEVLPKEHIVYVLGILNSSFTFTRNSIEGICHLLQRAIEYYNNAPPGSSAHNAGIMLEKILLKNNIIHNSAILSECVTRIFNAIRSGIF